MLEVPVFYVTSEGQTRRIAERLAAGLRARGLDSQALDIHSADAEHLEWDRVRGAVLGASIHVGRHQKAAASFAAAHARDLEAHPSAFFSVSLSAASRNAREVDAARTLAETFAAQAHWHPDYVASFAGALAYSKYGWLKRRILQRVARKEGGPTDTSRDHELTDWAAVDRLAAEVAQRVHAPVPIAVGDARPARAAAKASSTRVPETTA
jgi:menaquinone-dependent protoporphyrinogen oxidase